MADRYVRHGDQSPRRTQSTGAIEAARQRVDDAACGTGSPSFSASSTTTPEQALHLHRPASLDVVQHGRAKVAEPPCDNEALVHGHGQRKPKARADRANSVIMSRTSSSKRGIAEDAVGGEARERADGVHVHVAPQLGPDLQADAVGDAERPRRLPRPRPPALLFRARCCRSARRGSGGRRRRRGSRRVPPRGSKHAPRRRQDARRPAWLPPCRRDRCFRGADRSAGPSSPSRNHHGSPFMAVTTRGPCASAGAAAATTSANAWVLTARITASAGGRSCARAAAGEAEDLALARLREA